MKEINLRIKSITGTKQITKAMELVAISKLTKAMDRITKCRPYYTELYSQISGISELGLPEESVYCQDREVKKSCIIAIAGDRGLAGGYNSNLFKYFESEAEGKQICVLPMGKKAIEHFSRRGYEILSESYQSVEDVDVGDCFELSRMLTQLYSDGAFDELYVVYTTFVSMLSQTPASLKLLPLDLTSPKGEPSDIGYTLIEPSPAAVFDSIVPSGLAGLIWGAVCESRASELAARRIAMENATSNAEEIISDLRLKYNKARKSSITQQITEIVSGAQAE